MDNNTTTASASSSLVGATQQHKKSKYNKAFMTASFLVLSLLIVFSYIFVQSRSSQIGTMGSDRVGHLERIRSLFSSSSSKINQNDNNNNGKLSSSYLSVHNAVIEMNESNNLMERLLSTTSTRRDLQNNVGKDEESSVQYYVKIKTIPQSASATSSSTNAQDLSTLQLALKQTLLTTNLKSRDASTGNSLSAEGFKRISQAMEHFIVGTASTPAVDTTTSSAASTESPSSQSVVVVLRATASQMADLIRVCSSDESKLGTVIEWVGRVNSPSYKTSLDFQKIQNYWENNQLSETTSATSATTTKKELSLEEKLESITRFENVNANLNRHQRAISSSIVSYVSIYATLIHSLDTLQRGNMDEESDLLVEKLNESLNKVFADKIAKLDKSDNPLFFPVRKESENMLSFGCSPQIAQQALQIILESEGVSNVERQLPLTLMNHYPNSIMQAINAPIPYSFENSTNLFIWKNGITGEGEVVGCADTGIDSDQCFFHDPNVAVPVNKVNMEHRKIVSYQIVALQDQNGVILKSDNKDSPDGHGTHVTGSIAGSILNTESNVDELSKYNGVAPKAKLFFTDIMATGGNQLLIPPDLYSHLFKIPYQKANVRIHSNSWGCSFSAIFNCKYNCNCKWQIDTEYGKTGETVSNDFCVTNFGKSCCQICNNYDTRSRDIDRFTWDNDDFLVLFAAGNEGYTSDSGNIGSPTTSKNVLSVGASQTSNEGFVNAVDHVDFSGIFSQLGFSSEEDCCNFKGTSSDQTNLVKSVCCSTFMKKTYSESKKYFTKENLAYFSGRGPAVGGRIKPDLVAPGYEVESMHSDGSLTTFQCGTGRPTPTNSASILTLRGTSMSAPLTAGAAALVREYYRTRTSHVNPSGPLVKATLIHSSQPLRGQVSLDGRGSMSDLNKMDYPNSYTGFGLVSLASVLKFEGSPFTLFTRDRKTISLNARDNYCFRRIPGKEPTNGESFFYATITWYDMPSTSANVELIQDLDLNAYVYAENSTTSTRYPGNGNVKNDHLNNVEKVMITDINNGMLVAVTVLGYKLTKNQNYSIVITHSDDIESIAFCNPPAAYSPPISTLTVLILFAVFSALSIILIGVGILVARKYFTKNGPSTSSTTSTAAGRAQPTTGGRRLGNGSEPTSASWSSRLRDGFRIGDLTSNQQPQPSNSTGTHVRLEDEDDDLELQNNGGSTMMIHPNDRNNRNNRR